MTRAHRELVLRAPPATPATATARAGRVARRAGSSRQSTTIAEQDELFRRGAGLAQRVLIELESPPADLREGL